MLKFFTAIKHALAIFSGIFFVLPWSATAQTNDSMNSTDKGSSATAEAYNFFASARLRSPDRNSEVTTPEFKVNLSANNTVVLKGKSLNVTLESEKSGFFQAPLVRVSANGSTGPRGSSADSTSFNAGTFRITASGQHSFIFMEKNRGWVLELKLRPIAPPRPEVPTLAPNKPKSPVRVFPRKSKRLPA